MGAVALICIGLLASVCLSLLLMRALSCRPSPNTATQSRYASIDGLRGLLALSVVAHHFTIWLQVARGTGSWSPPEVAVLNQLGAGAVGLFFMITGLLFYPKVVQGFAQISWWRFLVGRFFRIVPLVMLSLVLVMVITALRTGQLPSATDLSALPYWISGHSEPGLLGDSTAGRTNAFVLWSLGYEWLFYLLLLPAMALAIDATRGRMKTWCVPMALLAVSLAGRRLIGSHNSLIYYAPLFAIGMLAAEISAVPRIAERLRGRAATIVAMTALTVGMAFAATPYSKALPLFAVFFVCVAAGNDCFGLLRCRAAAALGDASFGIYLLHGIVLSLFFVECADYLRDWTEAQMTVFLPALAACAACLGIVMYRLVERPCIAAGRSAIEHAPVMMRGFIAYRRRHAEQTTGSAGGVGRAPSFSRSAHTRNT